MGKSRLDKILDDEDVLKGVKDYDTGMMMYKDGIMLDYLTLSYTDNHSAYLYEFNKDILVKAQAKNLDDAKYLAVEKIEKKLNRKYN